MDYIEREAAIDCVLSQYCASSDETEEALGDAIEEIKKRPAADVIEIPQTGIGDLSDGYHTFNDLYKQRLVLFASIVKQNKDLAWKSFRHEDGELCFGGGWFIVGIDTPEGSYTYHYEVKDWDLFDCQELPTSKHWDGHTDKDVSRLLSLTDEVERKEGEWCTDCKEYDQEKHCCPRFNKVIRTTLQEGIDSVVENILEIIDNATCITPSDDYRQGFEACKDVMSTIIREQDSYRKNLLDKS